MIWVGLTGSSERPYEQRKGSPDGGNSTCDIGFSLPYLMASPKDLRLPG